jgi:hypothetical protein
VNTTSLEGGNLERRELLQGKVKDKKGKREKVQRLEKEAGSTKEKSILLQECVDTHVDDEN